MKSIVVYCGSREGRNLLYAKAARNLGELLAQRDITLVYGGGNVGLMGIVSNTVMANGGKVIGVITEQLNDVEKGNTGITDLIVVQTMHERKTEMCKRADGAIILPGAYGTLDELFEFVTWNQLGIHNKPLGMLNTGRFYDHLLNHVDMLVEEGFLLPKYRNLILDSSSADDLLAKMQYWKQSRPSVVA